MKNRLLVKTIKGRRMRTICALALMVPIVALPYVETVGLAFSELRITASQTSVSSQDGIPPPISARRFKIRAGMARELIAEEAICSAIIIDPDIATIEVGSDRILITGLRLGTTILIISGATKRVTYAIDVESALVIERVQTKADRWASHPESFSGFSSIHFIPGLGGGPSLLQHSFSYRQKLTNGRVLRASTETFKFFGGVDAALTLPLASRYGSNRITLGLDSPTTTIDFLDSELEISRLSFNGYTLRGPHFVSKPDSKWRGLEIFAGNARPQLSLFSQGEGRLAGAVVPLVWSRSLRIRSAIFFIAPSNKLTGSSSPMTPSPEGGVVLQTDVRYSPDPKTAIEGEVAYGKSHLSWRARVDLNRGPIALYGEHSHLDRRSPIIAIGAQSGGRTSTAFNFQWQPNARFNGVVGYDRTTTNASLPDSSRARFNTRAFFISANFSPTDSARLAFTFNQQTIDAPTSQLVQFLPNLQIRSAVLKYDQRISRRWTNNFEARVTFSREPEADAQMNRGLSVREQLRYTWRRGSVTGFVNYRGDTPSLEGLILRNPALLPVDLRSAFIADPRGFLLTNRDVLQRLLNEIELPLTRNSEAGIRIQSALARLDISGEVTYSVGQFMARQHRGLDTSVSAHFKFDAANSIQFSASRVFGFDGTQSRTRVTVGYTHRFGAGSGGGFQFARLLGIGRGHIKGRVFMDLNGNGQEDPGEKGFAGMKVQLDPGKSVISDSHGDFSFGSLEPGDFAIELVSDRLGVTLRASTATIQHVSVSPRQTINLTFGVTNGSFAAGRIFNDVFLKGKQSAGEAPGIGGVKVSLRPAEGAMLAKPENRSLIQFADGYGRYEFPNLAPGKYILEIDPATLPENFRLPSQTSWPITIAPLQGFYLDLPFAAQRAISGTVYIDKDSDGLFDPRKDVVVEGARIVAGNAEAVSTRQGLYLLRNLPSGQVEINLYSPGGELSAPIRLELGHEPALSNAVHLRIKE